MSKFYSDEQEQFFLDLYDKVKDSGGINKITRIASSLFNKQYEDRGKTASPETIYNKWRNAGFIEVQHRENKDDDRVKLAFRECEGDFNLMLTQLRTISPKNLRKRCDELGLNPKG